jgi:hypothetical protein
MKYFAKLLGFLAGCALCVAAHAQPGVTAISFSGTAMSASGSWASVPSPNFWSIGAILMDSTHNPIGFLSPLTTLNTASAASYPTGFKVTLGANAPAGVIVVVYRSTTPFVAGDTVDKGEYTGLCPAGCVAGDLIVPISGELLNTDFTPGASAMPVKLQDFSVD